MKRIIQIFIISVISFFSLVTFAQRNPIIGSWSGKLEIRKDFHLRIVFITREDSNKLKADIQSPDQSPELFPADEVTFKKSNFYILNKSLNMEYSGTFNAADSSISGSMKLSGNSFDLDLKPYIRRKKQEPLKPYPYNELEVNFDNNRDHITLAGTLTIPNGKGPFPAVVLISGSGPQDRDETVFDQKPFFVLADFLTKAGIAVLRYDDRGTAKSGGIYKTADVDDFAHDAMAAFEYLKSRPEINSQKIGLIGHSEGGMVAPILASSSPDIAFIVLMAGPGVKGDELLWLQTEKIYKSAKVGNDVLLLDKKVKQKIFAIIKAENDTAVIRSKIFKIFDKLGDNELEMLALKREMINQRVSAFISPEMLYLIRFDPSKYLSRVKCPVLALNGEKDIQVTPDENLPAIEKALKEAGNANYTVKKLWYLNHMFQTCDKCTINEYATLEETISPIAMEIIGDWILEQVKIR
jgi:uncharacterized protein